MLNQITLHMPLRRKFLRIGSIFLVVIGFLIWKITETSSAKVSTTENMFDGLEQIESIKQLTLLIDEHRYLGSLVAKGGNVAQRAWAQKREEISAEWQVVESQFSPSWPLALTDVSSLKQKWFELAERIDSMSAKGAYTQQSEIIHQLNLLIRTVSDQSEMTLDSNLGTYYLMSNSNFDMPLLVELLAQTRASGAAVVSRGMVYTKRVCGNQSDLPKGAAGALFGRGRI